MHHHTRNYSYDDQSAPYPSTQSAPHQSTSYATPQPGYPRQYDPNGQLYVPSNAPPNANYPRSMTVSPESQQHYASQHGYMSNGQYYNPPYHSSQSPVVASQTPQFIPTPSDYVSSYGYPANARPMSPNQFAQNDYYRQSDYQNMSSSQMPPTSARYGNSRSRNPASPLSPTSISSPTGERYPCETCGKTFSRSHDRKRHHETQHLATPVIHSCRYCKKEFSRADSLKRHLDNGCDERPQ